MDPQGNTASNRETTTIEWVLCCLHFQDIIIIVPWDLNSIPITSQYEEIVAKKYTKDTSKQSAAKLNRQKEEDQKNTLEI